jgi:hypothetical protein
MKRNIYKTLLLCISIVTLLLFPGCGKQTGPKQSPVPEKEIVPGSGRVWISPEVSTVPENAEFKTDIFVDSGNQKIAAYGFLLNYSEDIISLDVEKGNNGVEPGSDGYLAALNNSVSGQLFVAGYDVYGKGPGKELHFLTINWRAVKKGETTITITVRNLVDETTGIVGKPVGISGKVVVQ